MISRRRLDENSCEMYRNEKRTRKACKTIIFSLLDIQICDVLIGVVEVVVTYVH